MKPGSSGQPGGVRPVFTGARPDPDTPGIRSVMVWSMILTAPGIQLAMSCAVPGGSGEAEVAG